MMEPTTPGCIYIIKNNINDHTFVGSTSLSLKEAMQYHKSSMNNRTNLFYTAISTIGFRNFAIHSIKEYDHINRIDLTKHCDDYIKTMNPSTSYNRTSYFNPTVEELILHRETRKKEKAIIKANAVEIVAASKDEKRRLKEEFKVEKLRLKEELKALPKVKRTSKKEITTPSPEPEALQSIEITSLPLTEAQLNRKERIRIYLRDNQRLFNEYRASFPTKDLTPLSSAEEYNEYKEARAKCLKALPAIERNNLVRLMKLDLQDPSRKDFGKTYPMIKKQ